MKTLMNKTAIVTGASSGIGYATAKLFAKEGANVIITARRSSELDVLSHEIEEIGGSVIAVPGDIRDEALAQDLVRIGIERFGGLDIAFNNAGTTGEPMPVSTLSMDGWRDTLEINLTSAYLGAKYQVPAMVERGGGSLIFTSTFVGYSVGMPGMAAYAASKSGLIGLTQVLAAELGGKGIRANAVLPGGTDTPSNVVNAPGASPELRTFVEGLHALKRLAAPAEIARAVLFLASDASSFVTGSAFVVDGGVSITRT